jgi:hypothetical protein
MTITVEEVQDQIEITDSGHVQVRTRKVVKDDGVVIASNLLERKVINPGDDYSNESAKVQAICSAVHTQEVIDAYLASLPKPEEQAEEADEAEETAQ